MAMFPACEKSFSNWKALSVIASLGLIFCLIAPHINGDAGMMYRGYGAPTVFDSGYNNTFSMRGTGTVSWVQQTDAIVGGYNRQVGTISYWAWRSNSVISLGMCGHQASFADAFALKLGGGSAGSDLALTLYYRTNSGGTQQFIKDNGVFPVSNWVHVVMWYNMTNTDRSQCFRFWTNEVEITSFSITNYPAATVTQLLNATAVYVVGGSGSGIEPWQGNVDEYYHISGQLVDSTNFVSNGRPINPTLVTNKFICLTFNTTLRNDEVRTNLWTTNAGPPALDQSTLVP